MEARVVRRHELAPGQVEAMLHLMDLHYDHVRPEAFHRDLARKDYVILLEEAGRIVGFSTQQMLTVNGAAAVFSGDTIIHRDHWGSPRLAQQFARFFLPLGEVEPLDWFLISKGFKTYKFLPTFFRVFHPRQGVPTPPEVQARMDALARALYPEEYDPARGVIRYRRQKDCLKPELLDLPERRDAPDWLFFNERNPGHRRGEDLVCLTRLHRDNLQPRAVRILLGERGG